MAQQPAISQRRFWIAADALRTELAPLPGRFDASVRMLVACLLIVAISMTLQLPNAALSAYMVFFVSREDMATTVRTSIALICAISVAIVLTLLADLVTIDHPALRVGLMTVLFCAGMYLSRVFVAGPIGFGLGFILLVTQSTVDLYPAGEPLVRDTLWNWLAVCFSIVVVMLVNVAVLPARPLALLRQEALRQLTFVVTSLDLRLMASTRLTPPRQPLPGAMRMLSLLKLAGAANPRMLVNIAAYASVVRALNHLTEATILLDSLPVAATPRSRVRLLNLRQACVGLRMTIAEGGVPQEVKCEHDSSDEFDGREAPLLAEMASHLNRIAWIWPKSGSTQPQATPAAGRKLLLSDALSNPVYLQFALKAGFASMLCYIVYTALDWPGIHTCVITCAVIALTSNGATIHKGTLRLIGALCGGTLALLATVFVVPYLDTLGGLLLLIAPVAAISAWISAGTERAAYFGWQLAFAFLLCVLHGLQANTDVTLVRDRLVGIILGIVVMAAVFGHVWPERAGRHVRVRLADAVRGAVTLLTMVAMGRESFAERRSVVLANLADAERLAALSTFEREDALALVDAVRAATVAVLHLAQISDTAAAQEPMPQQAGIVAMLLHAAAVLESESEEISVMAWAAMVPPMPYFPALPSLLNDACQHAWSAARALLAQLPALLE
jgi:multidrug resistance protein MdtO